MRRTRGPAAGAARRASRRATVAAVGAVGLAMVLVACGASGRDVVGGAWNGEAVSAGARAQRGACVVNGTGAPCAAGGAVSGGCPVFPTDNPWNTDVSSFPVSSRSAAYLQRIAQVGASFLHPDFGSNPSSGIPYVVVPSNQPLVPITYTAYGAQSDPGPFPIPLNAPVEGGSDRHVLTVQQGTCRLYELFAASRSGAGWVAGSGAKFDLNSNALRPAGWTSADAAGLPILAGLVRYDEVASGRIAHTLRVTFGQTQAGYSNPARHVASSSNDDDLDQLKRVPASAFEVVETGPIQH